MPSDAAKRRQQQKKEKKLALDKKRIADKGKKHVTSSIPTGGATPMLDDKEKEESFKGMSLEPCDDKINEKPPKTGASLVSQMKDIQISDRSCTGVLASHPESRDIHIESLSLTFHGAELLCDAKLELNCGRRYGLVGLNGSGK